MIAAIFIQILLVGLLFFAAFKLFSRAGKRGSSSFSIRRLFHYSLLFFSVVITGVGVAGLLGRTLDFGKVIAESRTDLARNLSFTIVGIPLTYLFARWSNRNLRDDPSEQTSIAWHAYLTIASITSLAIALFGLHDTLSWAIGNDPYRGSAISQFIIWSGIWILHLRLSSHVGDANRPQYLIGSGIGLSIIAVGLGGLIGNSLEQLINVNQEVLSIERTNPIVNSAITLLMGLPVWLIYWYRGALTFTRDFLWHAYVFLAGIAASFITLVVGLSVAIYDTLVWFFGDTGRDSAAQHFFGTASALGAAASGLAIWSYHRSLLAEDRSRTELRRIYEYIVSGVSLIAASLGILTIIVAAIESITPSDISAGKEGANSLILAVTLLLVGAPIWWFFWNRVEHEVLKSQEDLASPTRRIFLLMLFGVSGVAAVISLISGIFLIFDDILNSEFGMNTLRDTRFVIGILLTNAAISGYHWAIYRSEKEVAVEIFQKGRNITLVGPADEHIAQLLKEQIGGHIQLWVSPDSGTPWNLTELVDLIDGTEGKELLVINEKKNLRALSIHH
jgi:hypothetical protein